MAKIYTFNYLYKMFDQSIYYSEPLSAFYDSVKEFSLETKALSRLEGIYKYQIGMNKEALTQTKEMIGQLDDAQIRNAIAKAREMLKEPERILQSCGEL